jgi:hypothetical protein
MQQIKIKVDNKPDQVVIPKKEIGMTFNTLEKDPEKL